MDREAVPFSVSISIICRNFTFRPRQQTKELQSISSSITLGLFVGLSPIILCCDLLAISRIANNPNFFLVFSKHNFFLMSCFAKILSCSCHHNSNTEHKELIDTLVTISQNLKSIPRHSNHIIIDTTPISTALTPLKESMDKQEDNDQLVRFNDLIILKKNIVKIELSSVRAFGSNYKLTYFEGSEQRSYQFEVEHHKKLYSVV